MSASQFTIYLIESNKCFDDTVDHILETFNMNEIEDNKKFVEKQNNEINLKHTKKYRVYVRAAETNPDWGNVLNDIVTDLEPVTNINYSYVCFFKIKNYIFAACGGSGYLVIDAFKKPYLGMDLLSRIVAEDDNCIKRVSDTYFTGNVIGGNTHFSGNVAINSEKDFNNIFKALQAEVSTVIIKNKLGIRINTKKKDYQLFAKDSIKLSKSLTINELDSFLFNITKQLNEEAPYNLIPFYPVNAKSPIIEDLDRECVQQLMEIIYNKDATSDIDIIPNYQIYDQHEIYLNQNKEDMEIYHTKQDMLDYVKDQINKKELASDRDMELTEIINMIKTIKTIGKIENEELKHYSLYEHIDSKVIHNDQTYWLTEGVWFVLERDYIQNLNQAFIERITNSYNHSFSLNQINSWTSEHVDEGDYNASHINNENTYVLDKILVDQIEVCDLLIENEDQLYFLHVKDGLSGDVKTLSAQIEVAMRVVHAGINLDTNKLKQYYQSIRNKIDTKTTKGVESKLSRPARKFIDRFQTSDMFVKYLQSMKDKITFVFAYRPLDSHDFNDPATIRSTAAKISMINLNKVMQQFDFGLEFMEIKSDVTVK